MDVAVKHFLTRNALNCRILRILSPFCPNVIPPNTAEAPRVLGPRHQFPLGSPAFQLFLFYETIPPAGDCIHEVQWCHLRHCCNTPPCWRYSLCDQKLSDMPKSYISYAKVIRRTWISYTVYNSHKSVWAYVRFWRNTSATVLYLQRGGVCRLTSLSARVYLLLRRSTAVVILDSHKNTKWTHYTQCTKTAVKK